MKKSDFKKGQSVFLFRVGDAVRGRETVEDRILSATVVSVGKKYITVDRGFSRLVQFEIDRNFRQRTDYAAEYELFLSEEDVYQSCKRNDMERTVRRAFDSYRNVLCYMSFDDLSAIYEILSKYI